LCHVGKIPALKLTGGFGTLKLMKVSIIVPAFNEELLLGKSLSKIRSLANVFGLRGWEVELIVCDNNSTDRTAEIARARNCGAAVAFRRVYFYRNGGIPKTGRFQP
jgi:glycosyltransferase involved in cell wall biosynthesis